MWRLIVETSSLDFETERQFRHARQAVLELLTAHYAVFFISGTNADGSTFHTLASPHHRINLVGSEGTDRAELSDAWVAAIVQSTLATGVLSVMPEEGAQTVLDALGDG